MRHNDINPQLISYIVTLALNIYRNIYLIFMGVPAHIYKTLSAEDFKLEIIFCIKFYEKKTLFWIFLIESVDSLMNFIFVYLHLLHLFILLHYKA